MHYTNYLNRAENYKDIRNLVWDVLIGENVSSLPVPIGALCKQMGITVKSSPMIKGGDGYSTITEKGAVIIVNSEVLPARRRFTIAHELGHILLGHVGKYELINREPSPNDNPIEQAANIFASRLLAPACVLWGLHIHTAEDIANICGISLTAAHYRVQRLNILYEREVTYMRKYGRSCFLLSRKEQEVFKRFEDYIRSHPRNQVNHQ